MVKEVGDLMTGELATEAPMNANRNYNGHKIAKFLVRLVPLQQYTSLAMKK